MRFRFLVALLAATGCFNPKLEDGFPCSEESTCPSGFECCSDDTCNRDCGGSGGCDAPDACQSAAWQTCDCGCLACSELDACEAAALLADGLSLTECAAVAGTDCSDPFWEETLDNNNTCTDAWDGYCDDGGPGSDSAICYYGSDCGDCGLR